MLIVDATSARMMVAGQLAYSLVVYESRLGGRSHWRNRCFVWARKRDTGRFKVARQVRIDDEALEKIADILGIPTAHRAPGTMYIATKKPPPPPPSGVPATRRRTRQSK